MVGPDVRRTKTWPGRAEGCSIARVSARSASSSREALFSMMRVPGSWGSGAALGHGVVRPRRARRRTVRVRCLRRRRVQARCAPWRARGVRRINEELSGRRHGRRVCGVPEMRLSRKVRALSRASSWGSKPIASHMSSFMPGARSLRKIPGSVCPGSIHGGVMTCIGIPCASARPSSVCFPGELGTPPARRRARQR